jgi:transposase
MRQNAELGNRMAILDRHVTMQIVKPSQLPTFKVMSKRWVVERSFAWLDKCRWLWKNCRRKLGRAGSRKSGSVALNFCARGLPLPCHCTHE